MLTGGMEQLIIDQGSSWIEIISALAAVAAVMVPLFIWWLKHGKSKK